MPKPTPQSFSPLKIGLGTWKATAGVAAKAVQSALELGYRAIDTACDYGNEVEVGQGIKAAVAAGVCQREDIFVTSKLWNTFHRKVGRGGGEGADATMLSLALHCRSTSAPPASAP